METHSCKPNFNLGDFGLGDERKHIGGPHQDNDGGAEKTPKHGGHHGGHHAHKHEDNDSGKQAFNNLADLISKSNGNSAPPKVV